jgi:hypothetical protein
MISSDAELMEPESMFGNVERAIHGQYESERNNAFNRSEREVLFLALGHKNESQGHFN